MTLSVLENVAKSARHTTFYLSCGPDDGIPMIFVHGWPELSISWRHQLPVFAGLGYRCIAPDMRGYGRSSVYPHHEDYAQEHIVADMIELLDHLGAERAVWVGHDWGAPVVWGIAQHHPDRCHAVANLCVPYIPDGFAPETIVPLANRAIYPEAQFPAAQWEYMMFYRENFAAACAGFEADIPATVRALFRAGSPEGMGQPAVTAFTRQIGGFFGSGPPPQMARDEAVLTLEDEHRYAAALTRNGFFGPDSWYMNAEANMAFAAQANRRLAMPVLFLHGAYDYVCETLDSRLADPMREYCADLTEVTVKSGHWMAQEQPLAVNAALARWLAVKLPAQSQRAGFHRSPASPVATVVVRREFEASQERVFDAWLDPASAGRWLFATPSGQMVRVEIDAQVGGRFLIIERRDGQDAEHRGAYRHIDRPDRLVFSFGDDIAFDATTVTVDIAPTPDGCDLTLTQEGVGAEWVAKTQQGWTGILAGLANALI